MNESTEDPGKVRILVVEDDPVSRRLVTSGLRAAGWQDIHEAEDGQAAREFLEANSVDVVVTDLMMPRMDGLSLIRWGSEAFPELVWIILSGLDTFDAAVDAIRLGAFDFLAKPPNFKKLEISVRNALRHRQLVADREKLTHDLQARVNQLEELCEILEDQAAQINKDLARAAVIQSALLPQTPPELSGFTISALYRPGLTVGGDLYDVIPIDDRHVVAYVADASGHGVSAAMLSVLFKQRLKVRDAVTGEVFGPGAALQAMNRKLFSDVVAPGMFVTAAYCLLDTRNAELRVASAGHPPVDIIRARGGIVHTERTGPALGLYPTAMFEERQFRLERGDRVLLHTDGLVDQPEGGRLTRERVQEKIVDAGITSGPALLRDLWNEATRDSNDTDRDDVTLVLIEAREGAGRFDNGGVAGSTLSTVAAGHDEGVTLFCGQREETTFIGIRGRGTYKQSESFYEAARASLQAGQSLTLDLSACEYLDSTFLGMIHEILDEAGAGGLEAHLQGVHPEVRKTFDELSMTLVTRNIAEQASPLPAKMQPLTTANGDPRNRHDQILRAHEILASLSEENRERFREVVKSLRSEIGGS